METVSKCLRYFELKNRSRFSFGGNIVYIRFLIYLKAIYGQEMTEIDFSTPAMKSRVSSIIPDSRS